jgi:hypothetical protein
MATKRNLLEEAIADAKAVKEMAIANAKAALEEAFEPQLKNLFSLKLQEMESDEELDEMKSDEELEEVMDKETMEEVDLEELLAELNEEESEEWELMANHIAIGLGKVFKEKANIPEDNYECLEEAEKMCRQNSERLRRRLEKNNE